MVNGKQKTEKGNKNNSGLSRLFANREKMDYMRYSAYYILLINKNFWIPAFAGMTKRERGMTNLGYLVTVYQVLRLTNKRCRLYAVRRT